MKRSKKFFNSQEKSNEDVFQKKIPIKALGEIKNRFKNEEYDIYPGIQAYFTNTKSTTKIWTMKIN